MNSNQEPLLNVALCAAVLNEIGFQFKSECNLPSQIQAISPKGSTNLRDAIMISTGLLIQLGALLSQLGANSIWNMVHIVLTDGDDTGSQISIETLIKVMHEIGQNIKVDDLKTYFIGVDLSENSRAAIELKLLADAGGKNAEFMRVNNMEINKIFEKIQLSLGVLKRTQMKMVSDENIALIGIKERNDPVLMVKKLNFVVLFTLDISGSMRGSSWNQVCRSVSQIVNFLGNEDLIGCVLFNEKPEILLANRYHQNGPAPDPMNISINAFNSRSQNTTNINYQNLGNNQNLMNNQKPRNVRFRRRCYDWPWYYFLPLVILLAIIFFGVIVMIFML